MKNFLVYILLFGMTVASSFSYATDVTVNSVVELQKEFEQNPSNSKVVTTLLKELKKSGMNNADVLDRYFATQAESDYIKSYNWMIVRDYVTDIHSSQIKYVFENINKFTSVYSKDEVLQKLDKVLVLYLETFYFNDKDFFNSKIEEIKKDGFEHASVISDYFKIRDLAKEGKNDEFFYMARKLFRYFPEDRDMIKHITSDALNIMGNDVSKLKVIQLWAGKTVEKVGDDFDAVYNYALISKKCGYNDVANKYKSVALKIAQAKKDTEMIAKAKSLA